MGFPGGAGGKEPTCQCRRHILTAYFSPQKALLFTPWLLVIRAVAAVHHVVITFMSLWLLWWHWQCPSLAKLWCVCSLPLMLLVKHQADSECNLGSGCFGRNPDTGKSKARQCFYKYISWTTCTKIVWSSTKQIQVSRPQIY